MIVINIDSGELRNRLGELGRLAEHPRPLLMRATGAVRKVLQSHFKDRDREPNRLGGRRTHFWRDVYRSTQIGEVTDQHGIVVIGDPRFAQKLYGGTIRAGKGTSSKTGKRTKALAIPVAPEAHGLRPAQLETQRGIKLFVIPRDFGNGLLAGALPGRKDKKNTPGAIKVFYALRTSVTQQSDPRAMPDRGTISKAAVEAAESYLQSIVSRGSPGSR